MAAAPSLLVERQASRLRLAVNLSGLSHLRASASVGAPKFAVSAERLKEEVVFYQVPDVNIIKADHKIRMLVAVDVRLDEAISHANLASAVELVSANELERIVATQERVGVDAMKVDDLLDMDGAVAGIRTRISRLATSGSPLELSPQWLASPPGVEPGATGFVDPSLKHAVRTER